LECSISHLSGSSLSYQVPFLPVCGSDEECPCLICKCHTNLKKTCPRHTLSYFAAWSVTKKKSFFVTLTPDHVGREGIIVHFSVVLRQIFSVQKSSFCRTNLADESFAFTRGRFSFLRSISAFGIERIAPTFPAIVRSCSETFGGKAGVKFNGRMI
jgi:hypothetical protein